MIDKDNGDQTNGGSVTVLNVAPIVSAGADGAVAEGSTFTGGGSFTDPGADTWTATVDYGDGRGAQPLTLTGKTFQLSHTYADGPTPTRSRVTVDDGDGGAIPTRSRSP